MTIAQNRIRILYYTGSLSIAAVLLAILGGTYLITYASQTGEKIRQLSDGIYDMKKTYVKDVIDRTIQDIDIERDRLVASETLRLGRVRDRVVSILGEEGSLSGLETHLYREGIVGEGVEAWALDRRTGKIETLGTGGQASEAASGDAAFRGLVEGFRASYRVESGRYSILLGLPAASVENQVREIAENRVRRERFVDDGYIWINWILDYDGGDDYAIRLVHPNLPETEGSYLSTNTEDIKGNKPYLAELEGLKKDGELYNEYYFKKMDSDAVVHKLSYTKLYAPYDWAIGTGVYLDDLDALVASETAAMKRTQRSFTFRFLGIGALALALSISLIVVFERRLEILIQGFQEEVTAKNRELEEEKKHIEEIAYLDPLTGLLNRRAMLALIERAFAKALRHGGTFSVVLGDIDHFKRVNDERGHLAGDCVLAGLAKAVKSRVRAVDAVSRWGGEEFLLLLDETANRDAVASVDRIRDAIAGDSIPFEEGELRVSMSFGVSSWSPDTPNSTELIRLADNRLYEAKERGRNRVVGE